MASGEKCTHYEMNCRSLRVKPEQLYAVLFMSSHIGIRAVTSFAADSGSRRITSFCPAKKGRARRSSSFGSSAIFALQDPLLSAPPSREIRLYRGSSRLIQSHPERFVNPEKSQRIILLHQRTGDDLPGGPRTGTDFTKQVAGSKHAPLGPGSSDRDQRGGFTMQGSRCVPGEEDREGNIL